MARRTCVIVTSGHFAGDASTLRLNGPSQSVVKALGPISSPPRPRLPRALPRQTVFLLKDFSKVVFLQPRPSPRALTSRWASAVL